jgi:hypothetical protein
MPLLVIDMTHARAQTTFRLWHAASDMRKADALCSFNHRAVLRVTVRHEARTGVTYVHTAQQTSWQNCGRMQWEVICVDKRETFRLWGVKLMEIVGNLADGRAMAVLLAVRAGSHKAFGRWAGNRIVLLGMLTSQHICVGDSMTCC